MEKNIALFIDGTWNKSHIFKPSRNTNVWKLHEACTEPADAKKYLPGVGSGLSRKVFGGLFGQGMKDLIKEAYVFLSGTYKPRDHIFLFGFSRGAFAARSLAGFVDKVGILLKDKLERLDDAYELYEHRPQHGQLQLRSFLRRVAGVPSPAPEVTDLPIYFVGVWDTVAALGLPGRGHKYSAPFTEYHQTELPSNISHARHALALHELRQPFEPLLWMGPSAKTISIQQVWFPGAHADVGGGYKETEWSAKALRWMADEAAALDLQLCDARLPKASAGYSAAIHHAIRGPFVGYRPTIRTVLAERRDLAQSALDTFRIHTSACQRLLQPGGRRHYKFWRPCVNEKLSEIDEESLQLLLEIRFNHPGRQAAEWWTSASVAEIGADSVATTAFIDAYPSRVGEPSDVEWKQFVRALCLQLLCDDKKPLEKFSESVAKIISSKREVLVRNGGQSDALRLSLTNKFATMLPAQCKEEAGAICEMMLFEREKFQAARAQAETDAHIKVIKADRPPSPFGHITPDS